ncbi:MAG: hypothetical protein Q9168_001399 [Polycauliona sp. 1 TL-2023]
MTEPSSSRVVLCTGGNRGLGFAIVKVAALQDTAAKFIMASRNLESGHSAAQQLAKAGVKAHIDVIQLDVTNDEEIMEAVKYVTTKYGKLDTLINKAGTMTTMPDTSLPTLRQSRNDMLNMNLTSAAVVSSTFQELLRKANRPVVINITSGLGRVEDALNKTPKLTLYGIFEVGMGGLTAHMQVMENDRIVAEESNGTPTEGSKIKYYSAAPGLLSTAFTDNVAGCKDPIFGAEVVVRLMFDDEGKFEAGAQWQFEGGEMRILPW